MTRPFHADTLRHAAENLSACLQDSIAYLIKDDFTAALGALTDFDDTAEDVRATLRLYRRELQQRRFK